MWNHLCFLVLHAPYQGDLKPYWCPQGWRGCVRSRKSFLGNQSIFINILCSVIRSSAAQNSSPASFPKANFPKPSPTMRRGPEEDCRRPRPFKLSAIHLHGASHPGVKLLSLLSVGGISRHLSCREPVYYRPRALWELPDSLQVVEPYWPENDSLRIFWSQWT